MLCINMKSLKTSAEVQKDIDIEDLLTNHTKYFNNEKEALCSGFVPLDFSTSIRSMYSNLVVQRNIEGKHKYYVNITDIQPFPHKGCDLMFYLNSINVMSSVNYKMGFDEFMCKHSQFMLVGLYNPDPSLINPIVYSHIVISDEGMKELPQYLKEDREIVSIKDIDREGNIPAMLDTLILVKERKENANDNNT